VETELSAEGIWGKKRLKIKKKKEKDEGLSYLQQKKKLGKKSRDSARNKKKQIKERGNIFGSK
jgi:hypothetical protein